MQSSALMRSTYASCQKKIGDQTETLHVWKRQADLVCNFQKKKKRKVNKAQQCRTPVVCFSLFTISIFMLNARFGWPEPEVNEEKSKTG